MKNTDIAVLSLPGGRAVNEDHVVFYDDEDWLIAVLGDGLGGCGKGDVASRIACKAILENFLETPSLDSRTINGVFKKANEAVCSQQKSSLNMKTTACAVMMYDETVCCAHIGDSRIYMFKQQSIIYQSVDHSVVMQLLKNGQLREEELRMHPDRNKVLRALGTNTAPHCDLHYMNRMDVDAILLCSDGFWQYVMELEMCIDLARAASAKEWINLMCSRMARRVTQDYDNFSVIAIQFI